VIDIAKVKAGKGSVNQKLLTRRLTLGWA